jgi:hypothetical protein
MKLKLPLVIVTAIMFLSPVFLSEQVHAVLSEQVHAVTILETKESSYAIYAGNQTEIVPTRLFLKSGNKLALYMLPDATLGTTQCQNGYTQVGLLRFEVEWKDVGTWQSDAILRDLLLSGNAEYLMWLKNTGTKNITDAAMEFTLKEGSNTMAGPVVVDGITIPPNQAVLIKSAPARINITSLSAGKSISVFIRAKYSSGKNGGDTLQLIYGTPQYLSYASIPTNAVKINDDVSVTKNLIKMRYTDAFGIDWITAGTNSLIINNERNNNSVNRPIIVKIESYEYECSWTVNLKSGNTYNITVALDYSGPPSWSKSLSIDIPAEKTGGGFLPGFETVTTLAIIFVAVATRRHIMKK